MKQKIIYICIYVFIIGAVFLHEKNYFNTISELKQTKACLLDSLEQFKINDSLNAVTTKSLYLTINDLKKYKADDYKLIKSLKSKIGSNEIKTVIKPVIENHTEFTTLYDTVYLDSTKHFRYKNRWTDLNGVVYKDSIHIDIKNKEELIITENLIKKKFLFFKLPVKLFGYKSKNVSVISKNPNTNIIKTEYINITK